MIGVRARNWEESEKGEGCYSCSGCVLFLSVHSLCYLLPGSRFSFLLSVGSRSYGYVEVYPVSYRLRIEENADS